ncbi:MAG: MBL fold metallo-hydrolase [Chloroflexota bacterium]
MIKKIANDVFWVDSGMANCYLCRDADGLCLIDTGMPRDTDAIFDAIEEIGRAPEDVTRILITHADIDHAGGLSKCLDRTGATAYAGAETASLIAKGRSPRHLPQMVQIIGDIFFRYPSVSADAITRINPGDTLPIMGGLEVIATPGHTLDHLSFFSRSTGVLFAGDILSTRDDILSLTPPRITASQEAADLSVLALSNLTPTVIACGHGAPITEDAGGELTSLAQKIQTQMEV